VITIADVALRAGVSSRDVLLYDKKLFLQLAVISCFFNGRVEENKGNQFEKQVRSPLRALFHPEEKHHSCQ
jgi:hypothetical protein